MNTPLPHSPLSRRSLLRGGSTLVVASAVGFGFGSAPTAAAALLPTSPQAPAPTGPAPYYAYTPNIKVGSRPLPDVAAGKPATASSFAAETGTPFNGNDGHRASRWSAADPGSAAWWKADLQGWFDLSGTRIVWGAEAVRRAYRIEVSADDATWRTVVDRVEPTDAPLVRQESFDAENVRFVRVTVEPPGDGAPPGFCDFQAYGEQRPGTDLALAKIAFASTGHRAADAVDGRNGTAWHAEGLYWRVDLAAQCAVSGAEVTWAEDGVRYRYAVEVSSDMVTWKTVADRTAGSGPGRVQRAAFAEQDVRYVRLRMIGVDSGHRAAFTEFKVFGVYSPGTDAALGKPATASSGFRPEAANDGSPDTLWVAADGGTHWWRVDLGAPYDLNTVRLRWENPDAAYRYTVEASADGITWSPIVDRSANTAPGQPCTDAVSATGARHVRVNFLGAGGWWAGLRTCELLGVPSGGDPAGGNVALGRAVHTNDGTAYAERGNGNDGRASTSFEFRGHGTPYVYKVDLRELFDLGAVEITWSGFGRSKPYQVEVSADNERWVPVLTARAQGVDRNRVSARRVRFVRVLIPSTDDGYRSGIEHFKILGTRSGPTDLAAGREVRGGGTAGLRWWKVELAGPAATDRVQIDWRDPRRVGGFTIEVSSDDVTWVPAVRVRGATSGAGTEKRLRAENVRFVRVTVPALPDGPAAEVAGLRVRGRITRDETVLALEARKSFDYFWQLANTDRSSGAYGLIAESSGKVRGATSVSGTGFGLAALAIGAERGWVSQDAARERALGTLETLLGLPHVRGVFYHYYDRADGEVWTWPPPDTAGRSEVGLIDTQLLLNGVLLAGEYFGGEVKRRAAEICGRVDWEFFRIPERNRFHMSYFDTTREFKYEWDWSSEAKLMYVLGAGSPTHPVDPGMFYAFERHVGAYGEYPAFVNTWFGSLFTYQFAENLADFRNSSDRQGVDWWRNAQLATRTNRAYAADAAATFRTFGPDAWGMTASDTPSGNYSSSLGAPPSGRDNQQHHNDGTLSPDGAAGSVAIDPEYATRVLDNFYYNHPRAWTTYGFVNAVNLDAEPVWYSDHEFALDKGIALLAIENNRSGLVWRLFMQNASVLDGMQRIGIAYAPDRTPLEVTLAEAGIRLDRAAVGEESGRHPRADLERLSAEAGVAQALLETARTADELAGATERLRAAIDALG
ncbi:hypothetical protein GCM10018781_78440 [Kitasatospora indigofera]|uniref:F5/8 type C domain-containing protein n=1 Tax=Kitasatospora indigofera TaxID=67307 RepID=A0A919D962_9ACTN|nr:hypothetical protein GCM10018781_78440 [Kitasatospora indigofera]